MHTLRTLLLALLAVAILAAPAWAATREGDKELSASISIANTATDDFDVTTTTIYGSFGYFMTKAVQAGAAFVSQTVSTEFEDAGATFIEGFVKYHFAPDEKAVPYVGALFGIVTLYAGEETGSGTTIGGMAGVKYFVSEDLSINGEYNVRIYEVTIADTAISSTTSTALIGMSYYFR